MNWKEICSKLGGCLSSVESRPEPQEPVHTVALQITVRAKGSKGLHKYSSTVVDIHQALETPESHTRYIE